jgi:putative oxidoreductase
MTAIVTWVLRVGLGVLFVYAGVMKLGDPTAFAIEIGNYRLWPELAPYLAVLLPAIEITAGLGVIALPASWRRGAALCVVGLMVMFTVAVSIAVARGINVDCGCFGGDSGPVTAQTIARDVALLVAAVALYVLELRATSEGSGRRRGSPA